LSSDFSAEFLLIGLSGGDSSELGVVFVFGLERSSESSATLSKTGSLICISGDSDILVDDVFPSMYDIMAFGSNSLYEKSVDYYERGR
jgi:hypothetical protein